MFSFSSSLQDKPTIQAVLCQTNKRRRDLDYLARSFFFFFFLSVHRAWASKGLKVLRERHTTDHEEITHSRSNFSTLKF